MKTAEQIAEKLWEKYKWNSERVPTGLMTRNDFLAALKEYGEAVRQKAAGVASDVSPNPMNIGGGDRPHEVFTKTRAGCASAIERMELP